MKYINYTLFVSDLPVLLKTQLYIIMSALKG